MKASQQFGSVASGEIYACHAALLQSPVGIERLAKPFGVTADYFAAA
jgi:hypothetical protein